MIRVSRILTYLGSVLILVSFTTAGFTWYKAEELRGDASRSHLLAQVRGKIQRVAVLELSGHHGDDLIADVDEALATLYGSDDHANGANNGEDAPSGAKTWWVEVKQAVFAWRKEPSPTTRRELADATGQAWSAADRIVREGEEASRNTVRDFRWVLFLSALDVVIVAIWIGLVWHFVRNHLERQARYDARTGLLNRYSYEQLLEGEVGRARRYRRPLSLVMVDIDRFKSINDLYGHDVGDAVLRDLAQVLASNTRHADYVCRIGGEEFAIITPETSPDGAAQLGEKLRQRVSDQVFRWVGQVTISVGVAGLEGQDDTATLFRKADQALYRAKDSGRNSVVLAA